MFQFSLIYSVTLFLGVLILFPETFTVGFALLWHDPTMRIFLGLCLFVYITIWAVNLGKFLATRKAAKGVDEC